MASGSSADVEDNKSSASWEEKNESDDPSGGNSSHTRIRYLKKRRWLTVLGAFIVVAVYDGSLSAMGVIMPSILEQFQVSRTTTSLLGPVIYGLPLFLGPIVCCLVSVFGCRSVALIGTSILGLSFILSGFTDTSFPLLFLTIGLLRSIGGSLMYSPAFIILPHWFPHSKRLGLAAGIAVCGSGFGGFFFPPILQFLLSEYGWNWALTIYGALCFNALIGCLFFKLPSDTDDSDEFSSEDNDQNFDSIDALAQLSKSDADLDTICDYSSRTPLKRMGSRDIYAALYKCSLSSSRAELIRAYLKDAARSDSYKKDRRKRLQQGPSLRSLSLPNVRLGVGLMVPDCVETTLSPVPSKSDSCHSDNGSVFDRLRDELRENVMKIFDKELFNNKGFLLFLICNFIACMWDPVPDFFLVDFAQSNMGLSAQSASFLPSVVGISSVIGQIIVGFISDHRSVNRILIFALCLLFGAIVIFFLPLINEAHTLYLLTAIYGFFFMSSYGMQSPVLFQLVGIGRLAAAFGVLQFFQGVANSIGIPFTGYLVDKTGSYHIPFLCCAFSFTLAGCLLVGSVLSNVNWSRLRHKGSQRKRTKSSPSVGGVSPQNEATQGLSPRRRFFLALPTETTPNCTSKQHQIDFPSRHILAV